MILLSVVNYQSNQVFSQEKKKIDLNSEYPCPCRRGAVIRPIVLTEAMGCDQCQQIFVTDGQGEYLEQLSTVSPHKKQWFWNGKSWVLKQSSPITKNYLLFILWFSLGVISLIIAITPSPINFWLIGIIILGMISLFIYQG